MVVEIAMLDVTTVVDRAGQLVTSGPQLVIVTSLKLKTVDVVNDCELLDKMVVPDARVELEVEVDAIVPIVKELIVEGGLVAAELGVL